MKSGTGVLGYGLLPENDVIPYERRVVKAQIFCGVLTVPLVTIGLTLYHGPLELPPGSSPFVLPARWVCLSACTLFWAVANVISKRYPVKDRSQSVIDGVDKTDAGVAMPVAFVSNTVEQLVLHVAGMFGLAATVSPKWLPLIPTTAVLFVVGRIFFYISYSRVPSCVSMLLPLLSFRILECSCTSAYIISSEWISFFGEQIADCRIVGSMDAQGGLILR